MASRLNNTVAAVTYLIEVKTANSLKRTNTHVLSKLNLHYWFEEELEACAIYYSPFDPYR